MPIIGKKALTSKVEEVLPLENTSIDTSGDCVVGHMVSICQALGLKPQHQRKTHKIDEHPGST